MSKEIDIDKDKVESTKLVIGVKTLAWAFGILFTAASSILMYFHNQALGKIETLNKEILELKIIDKEWKEKKFDPHLKEASDMKGDIKVILDRTNSRYQSSHSTESISMPNTITVEPPVE